MKAQRMMVVLALFGIVAAEARGSCPEGMVGASKTVVRYRPGPNVEALMSFIEGHIAYTLEQAKRGALQSAGPFIGSDDGFRGGMGIYNLASPREVRQLIAEDPWVKNRVVTASVHPWLECTILK